MNKRWKVGKAPAKKREKVSFWTAVFWCEAELPDDGSVKLLPVKWDYFLDNPTIEVVGRKATAEIRALQYRKHLNEQMLHPEDRLWRFKLVELKGGKR